MQALKLDAVAGWRWMGAGWRLFRSQPFSLAAMLFLYGLVLLSANAVVVWIAEGVARQVPFVSADAVAILGGLLVTTMTPALTIGFLQACRVAASGLQVHPVMLFAAFRAGRTTLRRLFVLGAVQMITLVAILLLTAGPEAFRTESARPDAAEKTSTPTTASTEVAKTPPRGAAPTMPTEAEQAAMQRVAVQRIVQGLCYLPVTLAMWFAPMLVVWHDLPPGKALFFSIVAVWRNRASFVLYGLAWLVIWLCFVMAVAIFAMVAGTGGIAVYLAVPLLMMLLTCMYCSVYPSYATVFVDPSAPTVAIAPTP